MTGMSGCEFAGIDIEKIGHNRGKGTGSDPCGD